MRRSPKPAGRSPSSDPHGPPRGRFQSPAPRRPRPGGDAIPTAKKRKAAPRRWRGQRAAPGRSERRRGPPTPDTQPLGVGVADAFAIQRLTGRRRRPKKPVRELGWAAFGEVARNLSAEIARKFRPSVVIGVAKGGVFAGSAIATAVGAEFYPVRIEKRRRDSAPLTEAMTTLPALTGKRVLVVDDVARTGATLARARALAKKAGAKEVRTAVLVTRPHGARPDFAAMETDQLVLFAWDYQLDGAGGGGDPGEVGV
jgi:hypoxanthine phosphoribosyltransferase